MKFAKFLIAVTTLFLTQFASANSDNELVVFEDYKSLSKLEFKNVSTLHNVLFGGSTGADLSRLARELISYPVEYVTVDSGTNVAFVQNGVLHITQNYFDLPKALRMSTLLHEAWHLKQGRHSGHSTCPSPFTFQYKGKSHRLKSQDALSGKAGCDQEADGAYAVEYVFLMSLVNSCTNCEGLHTDFLYVPAIENLIRIQNPTAAEALVRIGDVKAKEHETSLMKYLSE